MGVFSAERKGVLLEVGEYQCGYRDDPSVNVTSGTSEEILSTVNDGVAGHLGGS